MLIRNVRILTENEIISDGWLTVQGRHIAAYGSGQLPAITPAIDGGGLTLTAGFIDVHVHGGVGHDTMDADTDGLRAMAQFYARNGVTSFLPTTWTDSRERIYQAMTAVQQAMTTPSGGAKILGVHMEGPYLNREYSGAQNPDHIRHVDADEMRALFELDVIRLMAIAPEFSENQAVIRDCVERGIVVSVAHSAATYEQMTDAIALGLRQSTHTYNAQTGLHHRKPGIVGAVMTDDRVFAELIADTIHVHPAAMKLLWRVKGPDRLMLITDAIRASGLPDGEYPVDDRVMIVKDGACRLPSGTLAGSIITFNAAVKNFIDATGQPFDAIWQATSLNAARALHISHRKGSIAIGKDADLVLIDTDTMHVTATIVEGEIVYQDII